MRKCHLGDIALKSLLGGGARTYWVGRVLHVGRHPSSTFNLQPFFSAPEDGRVAALLVSAR